MPTRENVKDLIKALPPELQREVEDFVQKKALEWRGD